MIELLDRLDEAGAQFWLDGGWGVDCLLGEQTRGHGDLDIVIRRTDLDRVTSLLHDTGYQVFRDLLPTAVALRDPQGREVDFHPVDLMPDGGGEQALPGGGRFRYSPPVVGTVLGRSVRCAPAEDQLLAHQGYAPRPVDVEDVARLVARFGLDLPPGFKGGAPT